MRPDISLRQCIQALALSTRQLDYHGALDRVVERWGGQHPILVCLTVRSAFDLVLRASSWQSDDEVIFSALNIPQMYRIARHHDLRLVPVDIDTETAYWSGSSLESTISKRTRAVVLAHLFGARRPLDASVSIAHRHSAIVIEDCAQAYAGPDWHGDPRADVSLFSFGPMKTATALGGAIAVVRNHQLAKRMLFLLNNDPMQPTREYQKRILQYVLFRCLTHPAIFGVATRTLTTLGFDTTELIDRVTRNVRNDQLFSLIRRRPCPALIEMIVRRLSEEDAPIRRRRAAALNLVQGFPAEITVPTGDEPFHGYWSLPLLSSNAKSLRRTLREHGYDAMHLRLKALVTKGCPEPAGAIKLQSALAVPFSPEMSDADVSRLTELVRKHA